jgi:S-(hydroxymethyl)glutathione dehydrogenase/alcohol dehydrogenase
VVEEIDVGRPVAGEVMVQVAACGLCHSDEHLVTGDIPIDNWPMIGGHEAAGTIVEVGPGVDRFKVGDDVVICAIPSCGRCRPCLLGRGSVCDEAFRAVSGETIADGTRRIAVPGRNTFAAPFSHVGAFAPYVTVHEWSLVKIEKPVPLDYASLIACGVTTGWGAAINVAKVRPGDNVVVVGLGGVGASAVLASVAAGAERVFVIDPAENKSRWAFDLGATHFFTTAAEAAEVLRQESWGVMAESVILTPGRMEGSLIQQGLDMTAKLGTLVPVAAGDVRERDAKLDITQLRQYQKTIAGVLLGGGSPHQDVRSLLDLYAAGRIPLEKLVTKRYALAEINQGYHDMRAGLNLRGLLAYSDSDYAAA